MLYQTFPGANQGELNQRFVPLVSGETCAIVAKSIGLDELLHVDSATKTSKNVLGDAIEAVIAAIYLDGGFEVAEEFIVRCWGPLFLSKFSILREPKTELQEWLIKRDGVRPIYTVINREGPAHEPIFTVELQAIGFASVTGIGRSRQGAEQSAATAFLIREGVWKEETA